jgi:hypothetical protein
MKRLVLVPFVALAMVLAPLAQLGALAAPTLLVLSTDTFTNATSQHATEVEPDTLAVGSTLVSAFQVGRFFNGGSSDIGFATSTDGGASFTSGFLPSTTTFSTPAGLYARASDASVAFDAKHGVWLISYLGIKDPVNGPVDVDVSRSTDGGLTWSVPVIVNASGHFNDKNWTVCDNTSTSPHYGNCYTEFDDNTLGDLVMMSTSTDGGMTWGAAQTTQNQLHGIGGQPLVQPNGNVIVPIVGFAVFNFNISVFSSSNGGASWGAARVVAPVKFRAPAGGLRADIPLLSAEIDAAGKVYVAWSDCRFEQHCTASDLVFTTSNNGVVWSPVTRIPLDPTGSGVDHFLPGLSVDRGTSGSTAHLGLVFYYYPNANCTASTCQLDVGFSSSTNGGASWTANSQLAGPMTLSWLPNTTQGRMVGDYFSTSFTGGQAFPVFNVAHVPTTGPDCQTATPNCDQTTDTVQGGIGVSAAIAATEVDTSAATGPSTSGHVTAQ